MYYLLSADSVIHVLFAFCVFGKRLIENKRLFKPNSELHLVCCQYIDLFTIRRYFMLISENVLKAINC